MDRHGPAMKAQWREWIRDGSPWTRDEGTVKKMDPRWKGSGADGGNEGASPPGFSPPLSLSVTKRPGRAPDRSVSREKGIEGMERQVPTCPGSLSLVVSLSFSLSVAAERPTRCLFFSLSRPPALSPVVSLPSAHFCLPGASTLGFVVPPSLVIVSRFSFATPSPPASPPSLSFFFCCLSFRPPTRYHLAPPHTLPLRLIFLSAARPPACQSCLLSFSLCLSPTHSTRSVSPHPLDHCLPTPARSSLVIRKKKACAFVSSSLGRQSAQNKFFKKKEQKLQHRVFPCGPPP
jgi:hypothetical protein